MEYSPWFENDGSQYSWKENKNKDGIGLLFYIDTKEIIHAILWWGVGGGVGGIICEN